VLGDDHAGFFPDLILRTRPYLDYVVANDVVEALTDLASRSLGTTERHMVFCDEHDAWPGLVR